MKGDFKDLKDYKINLQRYEKEKSELRDTILPEFCPKFAEFMGALAGDGHITDQNNSYRVEFTLNGSEDKYYACFLADLFRELFHITPRIYGREGVNRVDIKFIQRKSLVFWISSSLTAKKNL
ncbi:MAG: hypothetical protein BRC29_04765 [Nanohaloarchaea archaeon SW_7_43_1]|nr:MAG: hypothetical protein BRC29_04765 [Nanohaloarchaea archaeon SW_7_43_1]